MLTEQVLLEQIMLVILVVFAAYSIFAPDLKRAIIGRGVFGVLMALIYLVYHAPDVALAEAIIAGALGTILFIITIRNYEDKAIVLPGHKLLEETWIDILLLIATGFVIFLTTQVEVFGNLEMLYLFIADKSYRIAEHDVVIYPIAKILLDYRLFDTIFEALVLLVSGVAVAHFITHRKRGGKQNGK